ncbi:hypothetical protein ALC62_00029 [Cyphomyrmex costatus]|uniref:HAT C-terminal dimerisation domain-containing protein n=1 Tax=Cyphomyrmex costatus TaxID=456900 RepID=A0A151K1Q5_9HYME|nr:hypothetical protein ALC62_00029 [Cyphomyrmex costatus]
MPEELKYYFHQGNIPVENNPIEYWLSHSNKNLQDLAIKYFSVIGTSVPSERVFSRAGRIMSDDRNKLSGDHLDKILFLTSLEKEDWKL